MTTSVRALHLLAKAKEDWGGVMGLFSVLELLLAAACIVAGVAAIVTNAIGLASVLAG
jgi:hypothetical protein